MAVLLNRQDEMRKYGSCLRETITVDSADQIFIAEYVFGRLVNKRFSSSAPVADILPYLNKIRNSLRDPGDLSVLEAESLIRRALGEKSVSIDGIEMSRMLTIYSGISVRIIKDLRIADRNVASLVIEAEEAAEGLGIILTAIPSK